MEKSPNGKWKIRAAVVGVFLLGCLAGALSMNVYRAQLLTISPRGPWRWL